MHVHATKRCPLNETVFTNYSIHQTDMLISDPLPGSRINIYEVTYDAFSFLSFSISDLFSVHHDEGFNLRCLGCHGSAMQNTSFSNHIATVNYNVIPSRTENIQYISRATLNIIFLFPLHSFSMLLLCTR